MTFQDDSLLSHWRQLQAERNQRPTPPMQWLLGKLTLAAQRFNRAQHNKHQCDQEL